jgi:hypothetical protein
LRGESRLSSKLPRYLDLEHTKLDWEAHRKATLKDRIDAVKHALIGEPEHIQAKIREIENNYHSKDEKAAIGAQGELEFLERMAFEEKQKIEVLEDNRDLPHPLDPDLNIKNPDYRVKDEIVEIKSRLSKSGKSAIRKALEEANEQIKGSGYATPTYTEEGYPQGKLNIQIIEKNGEKLKLSIEEISNVITRQCSPRQLRSLKEVFVYHENQLILQFKRDDRNRMVEVGLPKEKTHSAEQHLPKPEAQSEQATSQVNSQVLKQLIEYHNRVTDIYDKQRGELDPKLKETIDKINTQIQNMFQKEYPNVKLQSFKSLTVSKMALEVLKKNDMEGKKFEPVKTLKGMGFKQSDINRIIVNEKSQEMER